LGFPHSTAHRLRCAHPSNAVFDGDLFSLFSDYPTEFFAKALFERFQDILTKTDCAVVTQPGGALAFKVNLGVFQPSTIRFA
jgi:hypothetical protein